MWMEGMVSMNFTLESDSLIKTESARDEISRGSSR